MLGRKTPPLNYPTRLVPPSPRSRFLSFALPLLSVACAAPQASHTMPQKIEPPPSETSKPSSSETSGAISTVGMECTLDVSADGKSARLVYIWRNRRMELELDVPEDLPKKLTPPLAIFCQLERTIIVTPDYAIRTLGWYNLYTELPWLGFMYHPENKFLSGNTALWWLEPLGKIISATASENILKVVTSTGTYDLDMDRHPASVTPVD